jgi:hypothetical protein
MSSIKSSPRQNLAQFLRNELKLDAVRTIDALPAELAKMPRARYNDVRRRGPMPEEVATLLWDGTRLRWEFGREIAPTTQFSTAARRAWWWSKPSPKPLSGEVVQQLVFEELDKAQIGVALENLDRRLTPKAFDGSPLARGLGRWQEGDFKSFDPSEYGRAKRILLFIHGTFSQSRSLLQDGLARAKDGAKLVGEDFLAAAEKAYDLVLTFDHPTLSVGPALNAMDLAHALRPLNPSQIDIICHGRGGLVARWLARCSAPPMCSGAPFSSRPQSRGPASLRRHGCAIFSIS